MPGSIAILVPDLGAPSAAPSERPLGRAALRAASLGIPVLFATQTARGAASGLVARLDRWEPASDQPVTAVYDRFPCQSQPERHEALLAGLPGALISNPPSLVRLCRDKLAAQAALEARGALMPEVEGDPNTFAERLSQWGAAFLKPRYGSFGEGVRRLTRGQEIPREVWAEAFVLQRAIEPPRGSPYLCCRVLAQRDPGGGWVAGEPVVRVSEHDPVVNAARGASVLQLSDALPESAAAVLDAGIAAARALSELPDGEQLCEVGVDVVLDERRRPFVIEVNGRPRGRLEVLAAGDPGRFRALHEATCLRPIHWLWVRAQEGATRRGEM